MCAIPSTPARKSSWTPPAAWTNSSSAPPRPPPPPRHSPPRKRKKFSCPLSYRPPAHLRWRADFFLINYGLTQMDINKEHPQITQIFAEKFFEKSASICGICGQNDFHPCLSVSIC